jgi:hypothetical protein
MIQQALALIIIIFFFTKILNQKRKKQISSNEFTLWTVFWSLAALAIVFIKQIDVLFAKIGFSEPSISFLFYISVVVLFYLIFKLRLRMAKLEKNITEVVRNIALKKE